MYAANYEGSPCKKCGGTLRRKHNSDCVSCRRTGSRGKPSTIRASGMRRRASRIGVGCTLTSDDVAELTPADGTACPACGTPMERRTAHAPTFDRVDNREGYTPANVAVICHRCNTRKGDMTGAELLRLAQYVLAAEQAAR